MRITGLATGLNIDDIIKESMRPYQIKVDQKTQEKDVVAVKQKLYRDIIKDSREFFDKYLDIAKSDSLLKSSNWAAVSFSSSDENTVTAKANGGAIKDNYTVNVTQLAAKASTTLKDGATGTQTITFSYVEPGSDPQTTKPMQGITFSIGANPNETIASYNEEVIKVRKNLNDSLAIATDDEKKIINAQLNALNVTTKYSEISKGIVFEAKNFGQGGFALTNSTGDAADKYLNATITNSKGSTYTISNTENITTSNSKTIDGITFNFNQITCELDSNGIPKVGTDKPVNITGKTDATELKDKIVSFINDYNKYIEKLNKTLMTKHDRSYKPLTEDQKKEMSETEVKLWNERVEKGQLYKDSDITRIASSMKESMRTLMESSGLNLEKIGIEPVKDYAGTLNGTFTIDEDKLQKALENNAEDVMKLFNTPSPTDAELKTLSNEDQIKRKNQTGILFKLKDTINNEFMKTTSSPLLKKAGFEGTSTFSNNKLTKNISDYEKKIKDMQKDFSRREQALYSKYATLERMMNQYNSQQASLSSMFGM